MDAFKYCTDFLPRWNTIGYHMQEAGATAVQELVFTFSNVIAYVQEALDAGMEVIYTGIRQTSQMIVQAASQEDVDVIGMSVLSGAHMGLLPEIIRLLKDQGMEDMITVMGGIIPEADRQPFMDMKIAGVFGSGTSTGTIVEFIQQVVGDRTIA